jgi:hypothetical protein
MKQTKLDIDPPSPLVLGLPPISSYIRDFSR